MAAKPKCIFCDADLDADTKTEHVLLNALGGRKTTRRVICSTCNNDFGGTIDAAMAAQVEVLRNLLQLESGTGKAPPMLHNIQAGPDRLNFNQEGVPEITSPPFIVTELPDGRFDVKIAVRSEEALKKILPDLAAKIGIPLASLIEQLKGGNAALVEMRPEGVHHSISLGGDDALRSIAKSCLVLLAEFVGNDVVRSAVFAEAREFVRKGNSEFSKTRIQIDSRDVPRLEEFGERFGPFFNLVYVRSDSAGRVIGHFTLYNAIGWQIVIVEAGGPPDQKAALASNPLDPAIWDDNAGALPDISFDWLDAPDRSYDITQPRDRLIRMIKYHYDQARASEIDRIIKDVYIRHGGKDGQPVTDLAVQRAIEAEIATRLAAHALQLPHREQLSSEDIEKLLSGKPIRRSSK